ncbi:ABC transporter permease [Nisaea sediminum]|uniref:ABC transporter permease n=1 Tax=Nisaea sediminum TaxID=2775867 RepID=UPI0018672860|nr:iron ABC transporter permease [Nisaea sediminum]
MDEAFSAHSAIDEARPVRHSGGGPWLLAAFVLAALVVAPIAALVWIAFNPAENIWPHLFATVLGTYLSSTLLLMTGVGVSVVLIGTGTAWLVVSCRFPGRRVFEWALLLPLAVPAYVIAYTYTDLLEFAGPLQTGLRAIFGWETKRDYWFPDIRTMGGAIAMISLVLYPYVYAMARAAFLEQSVCVLEVSRTLGSTAWRAFFTVALPLARPAIVVGLTLALMETLNDFGTVDYFAVRTLTRGVFDTWFFMGNPGGAAQIALVMLVFVVGLIWIERSSRARQRFHHTSSHVRALPGYQLTGAKRAGAVLACALPILLGFVVPASVLGYYAFEYFEQSWTADFLHYAENSLKLSLISAVATVAAAVLLGYAVRLNPGRGVRFASRLASVGYAIPGAVLAIGILIPAGALDNAIDAFSREQFGFPTGLLLSGTTTALVFAYMVRFMAISFGAVEAGLGKVTPNMDLAARALGHGPLATLRKVHLPLIRGSLLTAIVLVFVDTMKELPATLVLRPFNFQTLATYVYQYASDELLEQCALAALAIVAAGILPVIVLSRAISASRPGHRRSA